MDKGNNYEAYNSSLIAIVNQQILNMPTKLKIFFQKLLKPQRLNLIKLIRFFIFKKEESAERKKY